MTTNINKTAKVSNVKNETLKNEVVKIDSSLPWNNIDKSAKNWNTPSEQAFQSFRYELFNNGGDKSFHPFLFNMLLDLNTQHIANKATQRTEFSDFNRGFQTKDSKFLTAYAERITKANVAKETFKELFNESELLDMKVRLHFHALRYWIRIGRPGFVSKRAVKVAVPATADDFKKNDLVSAFLTNAK
jgi:hypothetical protein